MAQAFAAGDIVAVMGGDDPLEGKVIAVRGGGDGRRAGESCGTFETRAD